MHLTPLFVLGVTLVLVATALYALQLDLKQLVSELLGFVQDGDAMYDVEQRKRMTGRRRFSVLLLVTMLGIGVRLHYTEVAPPSPVHGLTNTTTHARRHATPHGAPKRNHPALNRTTARAFTSTPHSVLKHDLSSRKSRTATTSTPMVNPTRRLNRTTTTSTPMVNPTRRLNRTTSTTSTPSRRASFMIEPNSS